jgi:hypothetical protein
LTFAELVLAELDFLFILPNRTTNSAKFAESPPGGTLFADSSFPFFIPISIVLTVVPEVSLYVVFTHLLPDIWISFLQLEF